MWLCQKNHDFLNILLWLLLEKNSTCCQSYLTDICLPFLTWTDRFCCPCHRLAWCAPSCSPLGRAETQGPFGGEETIRDCQSTLKSFKFLKLSSLIRPTDPTAKRVTCRSGQPPGGGKVTHHRPPPPSPPHPPSPPLLLSPLPPRRAARDHPALWALLYSTIGSFVWGKNLMIVEEIPPLPPPPPPSLFVAVHSWLSCQTAWRGRTTISLSLSLLSFVISQPLLLHVQPKIGRRILKAEGCF